MKKTILAALLAAALTSPAQAGGIDITEAWAEIEVGDMAHADLFLRLSNNTGSSDRLFAVKSPVAKTIHMEANNEQQKHLEGHKEAISLRIPKGETTLHSKTGAHIELLDLSKPLKTGDQFQITLFFENAGRVKLNVEVKAEIHNEHGHEENHKAEEEHGKEHNHDDHG